MKKIEKFRRHTIDMWATKDHSKLVRGWFDGVECKLNEIIGWIRKHETIRIYTHSSTPIGSTLDVELAESKPKPDHIKQHDEHVKEIEEYKERIKDKPKPVKRWIPQEGERYYHVSNRSTIEWDNWHDFSVDNELVGIGDCFRTREQAEEARDRIKKVLDEYHQLIGE